MSFDFFGARRVSLPHEGECFVGGFHGRFIFPAGVFQLGPHGFQGRFSVRGFSFGPLVFGVLAQHGGAFLPRGLHAVGGEDVSGEGGHARHCGDFERLAGGVEVGGDDCTRQQGFHGGAGFGFGGDNFFRPGAARWQFRSVHFRPGAASSGARRLS